MARHPPLLLSPVPLTRPATVDIAHVQLRDLVICPQERGVLNYVQHESIIEHDIRHPDSAPRTIAKLGFRPNSIASLSLPDTDNTLLAAGGQDTEIYVSMYGARPEGRRKRIIWSVQDQLGASINNAVMLTSLNLTNSNESSVEPRLVVSNNDGAVRFRDIPIRGDNTSKMLQDAGMLRLDVPVNHSSISPDGRTLLSIGDSSEVYLHHLSGGSRISFSPIGTLNIPPHSTTRTHIRRSALAAAFSAAFSTNGSKFAVASQEGTVTVWDVRSTKPLKILETDVSRGSFGRVDGNGLASGWLSDDPFDWSKNGPHSRAPGWCVRSVKFGSGGCYGHSGREVMAFTEHTSLVHIVDATTFETEEIVRIPNIANPPPLRPPSCTRSPTPPRYLVSRTGARTILAPSHPLSERRVPGMTAAPPSDRAEDNFSDELRIGRHGSHIQHIERPMYEDNDDGRDDEPYTEENYDERFDRDMEVEVEADELDTNSHFSSDSRSPSPDDLRTPHDVGVRGEVEIDLTGVCFDPSGGWLYAASTTGVAEWRIRGAEKRWWLGSEDSEWA